MSIKKSICFLIVLTVITCAQAFTAGDGTPENPYQISTRADLEAVNNDLAASYILMNDIDLSDKMYNQAVMAPELSNEGVFQSITFTGIFDGDGFGISNLTINGATNGRCVGLFGNINADGFVQNIGVKNCIISGGDSIGGLCGVNSGIISNCYSIGSISGEGSVGGLCGRNSGNISNAYTIWFNFR